MENTNKVKSNKVISDHESNDPVKFSIGEVVKHRYYSFYGVIFDVDPEFMNTEEWYQSIPSDIRPRRNQPFYHLFAENDDGPYIAYVSQQNLIPSEHLGPCTHPQIESIFDGPNGGKYTLKNSNLH